MCGIVGWANLDSQAESVDQKTLLHELCNKIKHRGPDSEGIFCTDSVALGVRRLAIIDVENGSQPVFNQDGSIAVIMNGEIYNFQELRRDLEKRGHIFKSQTDTQVLPYLYEEYGVKMVEKLNGMFAFALWDAKRQRLFIARDRFGKKPLYYGVFDKTLIFGSELKAITAHPKVEIKLNFQALRQYLSFEYVPAPLSIYQNIYKLPAAHSLVLENGEIKIEPYWNLSFKKRTPMPALEEAAEELRELLADSVKLRMISDVPLGVLLSGGIDSSSIAAFAQNFSSTPIKTFSLGFAEDAFDESSNARQVADYLGTEHYEERLNIEEAADLVCEIGGWLDEPISDPSILPTFWLSRFVRSQVTVALGGEGADEIFAGYPTYFAHKLAERYEKIPAFWRRNVLENVVNRLPVSNGNMAFEFVAKRFFKALTSQDLAERHHSLLGSLVHSEQELLLTNQVKSQNGANVYDEANRWLSLCDAENVIEKTQFLDTKFFLGEGVLTKVDRVSMAVSLEIRSPFLDYRLAEFSAGLSEYYKLNCQSPNFVLGKTGKFILKEAMAPMLPKKTIKQMKKGFLFPVSTWLKGKLNPLLHDLLAPQRIKQQGLFNSIYVQKLIAEHEQGRANHGKTLWTLLVFQLWYDNFLLKK